MDPEDVKIEVREGSSDFWMGGMVGDNIVLCRSKLPADYSASNFPSDKSYPVILVGRKSSPETSSGTLAVLYKD